MTAPGQGSPPRLPRVVLMASGKGSTVEALAEAVRDARCRVDLVGLVCDKAKAKVVERAQELGLSVTLHPLERGGDRAAWDITLADALEELKPDLIVLAGFMRILGPAVVTRFTGRVLNVHPSLLPSFPGRDAPAQAIAAGVALSGCSVHLVDGGVDSGSILGQAAVPVVAGDDASRLHQRIQAAERWLYPAVINAYAHGEQTLPAAPIHPEGCPAIFSLSTFGK